MKKKISCLFCVTIVVAIISTATASALPFSVNDVLVPTEGLIGFNNEEGVFGYYDIEQQEVVIEPTWWGGEPFAPNGLALVYDRDYYKYYIDRSGNVQIVANYKVAESFNSFGYAIVGNEGDYFYIDRYGERASVSFPAVRRYGDSEDMLCDANGTLYGIDENGDLFATDHFRYPYIDEQIRVILCDGVGKGLADYQGNTLITPVWDSAHHFCDDLALIQQNDLYGYIDRNGNVVIEPIWTMASCFHNGKACVSDGERVFYIDTEGTIILQSDIMELKGLAGFVAVVDGDIGWSLMNIYGEQVIDEDISSFTRGFDYCVEPLFVDTFDDKTYVIDAYSGKPLGDTHWDRGSEKYDWSISNQICVEKDGELFIVNRDGTIVDQ